jgi:hypothetical protein
MDANDRAYFLRRALQEQEAARLATCPEARHRHDELAAAYRFRCRMDALEPAPVRDEIHVAA